MSFITLIVVSCICIIVNFIFTFGSFKYFQIKFKSSNSSTQNLILEKIKNLDTEIKSKLSSMDDFVTLEQFETVLTESKTLNEELSAERENLAKMERSLEVLQKSVEINETKLQTVKSSHEEDEEKLKVLLGEFNNISNESMALEQNLSTSIRELDIIISNSLEETQEENTKLTLKTLAESLNSASSQLRDLIEEHKNVNKRINMVNQQHKDLEEEYTKLVEKQLG